MMKFAKITAAVLGLTSLALAAGNVLAADTTGVAHHHHACHAGPGPGPLWHQLHELNLSDAQKTQVKQLMSAQHEQMKSAFETLHGAHQTFDVATPGTSQFTSAQSALADAEAAAARSRVEQMSGLRSQIYALLTDEQKASWTTAMSHEPAPPHLSN